MLFLFVLYFICTAWGAGLITLLQEEKLPQLWKILLLSEVEKNVKTWNISAD